MFKCFTDNDFLLRSGRVELRATFLVAAIQAVFDGILIKDLRCLVFFIQLYSRLSPYEFDSVHHVGEPPKWFAASMIESELRVILSFMTIQTGCDLQGLMAK